ncbi:disease resistance protein RFL1-like isoform X1 [Olea europaea var. sylvestris]|uniref:disease resistance protein RFL1-like isoform X1 n=1 Tax=Olea europaea var. sylvestris TaxID=158386 RepID=UPI000C1D6C92|nr:disease resistance protein RFL1-like isoform X1 [Olea europaea var. sylvestris]XP_022888398.1 disease resistance protein RFL1-like isoform X1 [Olea europaea var. sylvestris]XP_022888399.1 disease resistance protein RFL1-like isoform X1 [Olea europaea var. sylvestris]XP_022888400.1 disease resistance protein RFL1-like isoform X1 [Olea europaea var. sylvestris]XP_022888401.1 disease resistance protein RFL1-like isoform X1 [Olea europaea var. sylvestris]
MFAWVNQMVDFSEIVEKALLFVSIDLEENTNILQKKKDLLTRRRDDLHAKLQNAVYLPRKKRKTEVEDWLGNVEDLITEFETLRAEVQRGRILARKMLSERVETMTKEAMELLEQTGYLNELYIEVDERIAPLLVSSKHNGRAFLQIVDEIWVSLMDDSVLSIGIYGMAGVGKTTVAMYVHDKLLEEPRFCGQVYWITVSEEFTIYKLQNEIAVFLKLDLSDENGVKKRAAKLSQVLKKREKFVLILDNVMKQIDLEDIGISEGMTGSKLVITTQSENVYQWMGCHRIIKVNTLPHQEALELFFNQLCRVERHPEVERICNKMVERCGGLPLALVKLAKSMRGKNDIEDWRYTSGALENSCMGLAVMENDVFPILSDSYEQLSNTKLKSCFLTCSLYPENHPIPREELIESFISEKLVERSYKGLGAEIDQGHAILNQLEGACLLERASTDRHVKMHYMMRSMAIWIKKPRYMVKAGHSLGEIPEVQEWTDDLDVVSLMNNSIEEIPPGMTPKCCGLLTLILRQNPLKSIPNCFFEHMHGLQTLNLSDTSIQNLPDSMSDLENLRTLLLKFCNKLESVPSLEKLKELRHLDLTGTSIEEVPQGMDSLINLRFLYLRCPKLKVLPTKALHKFSHLQRLSLPSHICMPIKEVEAFKHLEVLEG